MRSGARRSRSRGRTAMASRRRSRASARRSPTSSRSSRRPAEASTARSCSPSSRRASSRCSGCPASGPKTVRLIYTELGVKTARRAQGRPPRPSGSATLRGLSERTEQKILEGIERLETRARAGCSCTGRRRSSTRSRRPAATSSTSGRIVAGGLVPAPEGDDRRPRPPGGDGRSPKRVVETFVNLPSVEAVHRPGRAQGGGPARRPRAAGRPDADAPERGAAPTSSTSPGSKEHNVRLRARWPATRAGACPSTASRRIDEDGELAHRRRTRSCGRSRPRRRRTRSSGCRSSSPSCARTAARSRRRSPARLPTLVDRGGPPRRPPLALGLVRRRDVGRGRWPSSRGGAATPTRS